MFTLTMTTDNAAFNKEYPNEEIARILKDCAKQLENGYISGPCIDSNGNRVGQFGMSE